MSVWGIARRLVGRRKENDVAPLMISFVIFSWQPIIDYIDSKYEEYLNAESRVIRKAHIVDNRIHCCLYFLTPTGHRFVLVPCVRSSLEFVRLAFNRWTSNSWSVCMIEWILFLSSPKLIRWHRMSCVSSRNPSCKILPTRKWNSTNFQTATMMMKTNWRKSIKIKFHSLWSAVISSWRKETSEVESDNTHGALWTVRGVLTLIDRSIDRSLSSSGRWSSQWFHSTEKYAHSN